MRRIEYTQTYRSIKGVTNYAPAIVFKKYQVYVEWKYSNKTDCLSINNHRLSRITSVYLLTRNTCYTVVLLLLLKRYTP